MRLRTHAPHFWNHLPDDGIPEGEDRGHLSEEIRVEDVHLRCYVYALLRFWGLADRAPLAVIDPFVP
jgi:hypothetical protein